MQRMVQICYLFFKNSKTITLATVVFTQEFGT